MDNPLCSLSFFMGLNLRRAKWLVQKKLRRKFAPAHLGAMAVSVNIGAI
jgi:hypothetical protein